MNSENPVDIISYNLWNVNSQWEKRMQKITDLMKGYSADVVAFQEVRTLDRKSGLNILTPYRMNADLPIPGSQAMPSTCNSMMNLLYSYMEHEYPWAVFVPMAGFTDGTQEGVAVSFIIIYKNGDSVLLLTY